MCQTDDWLKDNDPLYVQTFGKLSSEDYMDLDEAARLHVERNPDTTWDGVGYANSTPVDKAIRSNGAGVFVTGA